MRDYPVSIQDPERAIIEAAVGMFLLADQTVAPRDFEICVRNEKVRQLLAEKCKRVFSVLFPRIRRNHDQLGAGPNDLRVVLLQRSSDTGGSVGVIPITVLACENELVMTGRELAQCQSVAPHLDEKLRCALSDVRFSLFVAHTASRCDSPLARKLYEALTLGQPRRFGILIWKTGKKDMLATTTFSTLPMFRTGDGELPKNVKYLCNHPDLSHKTKEKIAYHNGKEYFQLDRPVSAPAGRKAN
jgi:hypothetical protein